MNSAAPGASRGHFAEIVRLQRAGERAVLVTPIRWSGSVPLSAESKLVLREDASIFGTVGGGQLEAAAIVAARSSISGDEARVLEFELTQTEAASGGMICGGRATLLVEPIAPDRQTEVLASIAAAEEAGDPVLVVTRLSDESHPRKLALFRDGSLVGGPDAETLTDALLAEAERVLDSGRSRLVEAPMRAHLDPILPRPTAYIFGAGHVAMPVAHLADLVGFSVVVTDDREEFANRERFPRAAQVLVASVADAFRHLPIAEDGYIVTVTRGHAMDEDVVAEALRTAARYIGMIGSRRKVEAILERLRDRGFSEGDLSRIHAPIGLDIGADTVEEIAVSIVAEMISVRRQDP